MDVSDLRPGCYGAALCCRPAEALCAACPFLTSCEPLAAARLEAIRVNLGMEPKVKAAPKLKREPRVKGAPKPLSGPTAALVQNIAGLEPARHLQSGSNPFDGTSYGFLRVIAHILIGVPAGVSRALIIEALERKMNWSRGTAVAHAGRSLQALSLLDAIVEKDGRVFISRS